MAADRLSDFPIHRSYANSYEAQNGLAPEPDQDWTSADVNRWKTAIVNHADILDEIGVDIGDMDALDGGHETIIEAINAALAGILGDIEITDVEGLETALATLTTNVASATQDAANAGSAATSAQTAASAATASANSATAAATAAINAVNALTDPIYGSIATSGFALNASMVGSRELFLQLVDTTSGDLTVVLASDHDEGQELIINRVYGDNNLIIDAGADIDFYGEDADPLTLNYRGWVHLKKTATGWITVDHKATDPAAV